MPKPKVLVDICTACTAKCRYCTHQSLNLVKPRFMQMDTFKVITDILAKENFLFIHLYMSGEPLLHPQFLEFLEILSEKGISCSIASKLNVKIDRRISEVLEKHKSRIEFVITLDAIDQDTQVKISPGISTKLVLENLDFIKQLRKEHSKVLKLIGVIVVNSFNIICLKEIRSKLVDAGCSPIYIKPMGAIIPYVASLEFLEYLEKMVVPTSRFKIVNGEVVSKGRMGCTSEPAISPEGDVTICCHDMLFSVNVGNIVKEKSLEKILSSEDYRKAIAKRGAHPFCKGCN